MGCVCLQEVDDSLPEGVEPLVLWQPPEGAGGQPVLVHSLLTRFLRPHQREGVQFMFECVAGLRMPEGQGGRPAGRCWLSPGAVLRLLAAAHWQPLLIWQPPGHQAKPDALPALLAAGCILADDMGLGKTLQVGQPHMQPPRAAGSRWRGCEAADGKLMPRSPLQTRHSRPPDGTMLALQPQTTAEAADAFGRPQGISLLWTLLQNGHELLGGVPLARRVIIVCPPSLVSRACSALASCLPDAAMCCRPFPMGT
jgi:hypothetical protein